MPADLTTYYLDKLPIPNCFPLICIALHLSNYFFAAMGSRSPELSYITNFLKDIDSTAERRPGLHAPWVYRFATTARSFRNRPEVIASLLSKFCRF